MASGNEKSPLVIKVGGALLKSTESLDLFFTALRRALASSPRKTVIVHGGGCFVDNLMKLLGRATVKKHGLRVTPEEDIPYIAGALAGTANKILMARAVASGFSPVGLSLSDGGLCEIAESGMDLGSVGDAAPGNPGLLSLILNSSDCLPLISSIGITPDGRLMNVNADDAAMAVAEMLSADLALLSDVPGILDADGKVIPEITADGADSLVKNGVISGGMEVKVRSAFKVAESLGRPVSSSGSRSAPAVASPTIRRAVSTAASRMRTARRSSSTR